MLPSETRKSILDYNCFDLCSLLIFWEENEQSLTDWEKQIMRTTVRQAIRHLNKTKWNVHFRYTEDGKKPKISLLERKGLNIKPEEILQQSILGEESSMKYVDLVLDGTRCVKRCPVQKDKHGFWDYNKIRQYFADFGYVVGEIIKIL